jgi:hypothetical protein
MQRRTMRLEAAVRDGVNPIVAFDDILGLIEQPLNRLLFPFFFVFIVTWFAVCLVELDATTGHLGAFLGLGGLQVVIGDKRLKHFILDL